MGNSGFIKKQMEESLTNIHHLRSWDCVSLLHFLHLIWILTFSLVLKRPRKLESWLYEIIRSFFLEVTLFLHKFTVWLWMQRCCHDQAGSLNCFQDMLVEQHKLVCRTVDPSLVTFLESFTHCQNVFDASLYYRYYFGG